MHHPLGGGGPLRRAPHPSRVPRRARGPGGLSPGGRRRRPRHWIAPEEGKWTYTYHKRLFAYDIEGETIDQIDAIVRKLAEAGHSRRAQAITWNPKLDPSTYDPPCLQRVWCRILPDENGVAVLNMNCHWRSRDAYKAAYMNAFALTDLQRIMASRIAERIGRPVRVGRYADLVDSFHIYGSYFAEFQGFLKMVEKRTFEERTWPSSYAEPMFQEARERLRTRKILTIY